MKEIRVGCCEDCPLRVRQDFGSMCNIYGDNIYNKESIPEFCPLKEESILITLNKEGIDNAKNN